MATRNASEGFDMIPTARYLLSVSPVLERVAVFLIPTGLLPCSLGCRTEMATLHYAAQGNTEANLIRVSGPIGNTRNI